MGLLTTINTYTKTITNNNRKKRVSYIGYTNYWEYKPDAIEDTEKLRKMFSKASKQIKKFVDFITTNKSEIYKICGGLGEGKPIFNESEVWFNGDRAQNLDYETFKIHWSETSNGFCKTARKPYDIIVCFALLTFAEIFPKEAFSFSSDGTMTDDEWQIGCEFYETFTGKTAKIPDNMM